jgi:hypothetical protein
MQISRSVVHALHKNVWYAKIENESNDHTATLRLQSMDISIRHPLFYAIYFIYNHVFKKKVISKRILIIFAPEETEIFKRLFVYFSHSH